LWPNCGHENSASLLEPGSIVLRYLAEEKVPGPITGLFFVATPYFGPGGWNADGRDISELVQQKNFVSQVTQTGQLFFYHNRDDSVVPFAHLGLYKHQLPRATVRASTVVGINSTTV
jgi:hypothetical protein